MSASSTARRLLAAGVGLAIATGASAAALAVADSSSPASTTAPSPAAERVSSVPAEASQAFQVLARPQRLGEALAARPTGPFGANLDLAREVATTAGAVRVVPAEGEICLRAYDSEGWAWGCTPTDQAAASGSTLTFIKPGAPTERVFTLVPDGVTAVTYNTTDGPVRAVVSDNIAGAEISPASTATLTGSQAPKTITVPAL